MGERSIRTTYLPILFEIYHYFVRSLRIISLRQAYSPFVCFNIPIDISDSRTAYG